MYALMGIGGQELIFLALAAVLIGLFVVLPIVALVNVIRSEFRGPNDKLIWVIVILFLNIIGVLLYYTIGRNQPIA